MSRRQDTPPVGDLRHGVTEVEHQVLDLIDSLPPASIEKSFSAGAAELEFAFGRIKQARRTTSGGCASTFAREAAARLIRFAQQHDDYVTKLRSMGS